MIFIIGSGPAGVACAKALLERDCAVTMLDVGVELEVSKRQILDGLKTDWDEKKLVSLKQTLNVKEPIKLNYNSNYPYAKLNEHISLIQDIATFCTPSLARGGLSNVWGAVVEEYTSENFFNWPISKTALTPYYEKIFKFLYRASSCDTEASSVASGNYYRHSAQAKKLLACWSTHRKALHQLGFEFGSAELAVKFNSQNDACIYCGACQHGCPKELIYSSAHTLNELIKHPKFTYIPHMYVERIKETSDGVTIFATRSNTKDNINFQGSQVFLACGTLMSTLIVLRSTAAYQQKIQFTDSTHFMLPALMRSRVTDVAHEKLFTLCQLFLRLNNSAISKQATCLQLYTYMDHYSQQMQQLFKGAYPLVARLMNPILDRLVVMQCFLDSQESHKFTMTLLNEQQIQLDAVPNPQVAVIVKRLIHFLMKNSQQLGIIPIKPMLKISKIGRSFHYGCSMPMRENPTGFATDVLGRPPTFKRLHVVDASVLPSIAAGSITPTIMANAYRIASECDIYEKT